MKYPIFFQCMFLLFLASCKKVSIPENELFKASSDDFTQELTTVSPSTDTSLALKLWAPGPLLANAVAISIDNQGNAYVSQTSRRKSSYLDIREHWDWMIEDLALQTAADKTRFYLKVLSPEYSKKMNGLKILMKTDVGISAILRYKRRAYGVFGMKIMMVRLIIPRHLQRDSMIF